MGGTTAAIIITPSSSYSSLHHHTVVPRDTQLDELYDKVLTHHSANHKPTAKYVLSTLRVVVVVVGGCQNKMGGKLYVADG
jgi:hypothetical protein